MKNDTLFYGKRHVVFSKTSRRLKMNKPKKQKNVIMGAEIMFEERTTKSNDENKKGGQE